MFFNQQPINKQYNTVIINTILREISLRTVIFVRLPIHPRFRQYFFENNLIWRYGQGCLVIRKVLANPETDLTYVRPCVLSQGLRDPALSNHGYMQCFRTTRARNKPGTVQVSNETWLNSLSHMEMEFIQLLSWLSDQHLRSSWQDAGVCGSQGY